MKLSAVLADLSFTSDSAQSVLDETEIAEIVYDSRKAAAGVMFVCLVGAASDGHDYAASAYEHGCRAFLAERRLTLPSDAVQIVTPDTRRGLALASAAFFGYPARSLVLIGVTGTKGKTTVTSLIYDLLNAGGIPTASIGTTGIVICGERTPTVNTTPESYELHKSFRKMIDAGISAVVMEVSSQAVYMRRIEGLSFHIGVFTNLSHDHIGGAEHPTFEHYMSCKAQLFRQCRYGIFNGDDPHYTDMVKNSTSINSTFGIDPAVSSDVFGHDLQSWKEGGLFGERFRCRMLGHESVYTLRMPGTFSVYNALAAISVGLRMGVPEQIMRETLETAAVRGRFELIDALPGVSMIIDYAHNAASMKAALETIRHYQPKRLIVLFGSVGGRTKLRRTEMGEIAGRLADFCVLTSDNPDSEPPMDIIRDIEASVSAVSCPFVSIPDRGEAVKYAVEHALPGDCILFAGKGHEDYQIVNGERLPYDERGEILAAAAVRRARVGS